MYDLINKFYFVQFVFSYQLTPNYVQQIKAGDRFNCLYSHCQLIYILLYGFIFFISFLSGWAYFMGH